MQIAVLEGPQELFPSPSHHGGDAWISRQSGEAADNGAGAIYGDVPDGAGEGAGIPRKR